MTTDSMTFHLAVGFQWMIFYAIVDVEKDHSFLLNPHSVVVNVYSDFSII